MFFSPSASKLHPDPARQPLLGSSTPAQNASDIAELSDHESDGHDQDTSVTPLPYRQLIVLCLMRITEPVSQGLIQPFINQMLEDIKVTPDRTKIGFYAGIITSLFAFSQLCTTFWWGMLSDRIGRKPILLSGLTGLSISIISFGLQTSFVGLVIARCFAGVMNGNVAIVKSVLAELTDNTNKARAFALLPTCNAIGMILGPMIGGYLAQPAQQYPGIFGNIQFLIDYPYFLPCFIAGLTNALAVILGFFYLEETLPSREKKGKTSTGNGEDENEVEGDLIVAKPKFSALFTPTVISVLLGSILVFFQNSSWAVLVPMFAYTRFEDGGLGLNMNEIGTALTTNGFAAIIIQTIAFPHLQKRWGTLKVFRTVLMVWPIAFGLLPVIRWMAKYERDIYGQEEGSRAAMIGLMSVLAIKGIGGISMVCLALLVNAAAPSPSTFGALNGLGQSCSALARTFAPAVTGAVFSISINQHGFGANLIWFYGILMSLMSFFVAQTIKIKSDQVVVKPRRP